jgi:hypothetical protein
MSKNVLFTAHPVVGFIWPPPFRGEHMHPACQRFLPTFHPVFTCSSPMNGYG